MSDEKYCLKLEKCDCNSGSILADLSYQERFAGYHDQDGNKIYFKTVLFDSHTVNGTKLIPHNILNFKELIKMDAVYRNPDGYGQGNFSFGNNHSFCFYVDSANVGWVASNYPWNHTAKVTIYYTCTDR